MKALTTSFRSKAIVESLGSSYPRVAAIRVSDRPEFYLSLHPRNDKKGSNFLLLKLVQNKGIYPVHAVPPKNPVDLENVEPQAQQSDQRNESKFVRVAIQLQKICDFGEHFLIVGDDPVLGSWDPSDAILMTWSDGHIWTVELDLPAGKSIQYKFLLKGKGGHIIWQPGSDRIIDTWETTNRITVCEDWEDAELQKIIEEDKLPQPNEESQVVSEVSTSAEILDNPVEDLESNVSKISGIEDTQIHAEEKPVAEPVLQQVSGDSISSSVEKPMAIIAENIGSSEDLMESTSLEKNERNVIQQSEESADSPRNDDIIHYLGYNGNAAPLNSQERTTVEGSLFDFEGGPVLVPGLTPPIEEAGPGEVEERTAMDPSIEAFETQDQNAVLVPGLTLPIEEAGPGEVEERTAVDPSIEAFETQDQNIPELSKEQESHDGTPQEISATINDKEFELLDSEHEEQSHLVPTMEDGSNSQPVYGNTMQNDIQWGRETVKKFLTKLGFL